MDLKGKTVLLTGASGGIGQVIAQRLSDEGAKLIITARNVQKMASLKDKPGMQTIAVAADITTQEGRCAVVEATQEHGVDIVVHNAGTMDFGLLSEQAAEDLERMAQLNLMTPILLTRQLLPLLQNNRESALVFIGSTFGSIGHPGFVMYCATKFGLRGFAEGLRRELANTSVTVHYLAPRATKTDLNTSAVVELNESIGNAMDAPSVVADELVSLLNARKGVNRYIGWPEKLFVRINSLLPGIVDNALAKKLATIRRFAKPQKPSHIGG